jgi:hypothetical protein
VLSPWAQEAKEHLQKHRPNMYQQMQKAGTLDGHVEKMANNARDEFHSAAKNGMDPYEAESEARKNNLFPPGEEDQPHLGASPISSQDPTNLATTTVSPKPTTSGKAC